MVTQKKTPKKVAAYMKEVTSKMGGPKKQKTRQQIINDLGVAPKKPRKRSKYAD